MAFDVTTIREVPLDHYYSMGLPGGNASLSSLSIVDLALEARLHDAVTSDDSLPDELVVEILRRGARASYCLAQARTGQALGSCALPPPKSYTDGFTDPASATGAEYRKHLKAFLAAIRVFLRSALP